MTEKSYNIGLEEPTKIPGVTICRGFLHSTISENQIGQKQEWTVTGGRGGVVEGVTGRGVAGTTRLNVPTERQVNRARMSECGTRRWTPEGTPSDSTLFNTLGVTRWTFTDPHSRGTPVGNLPSVLDRLFSRGVDLRGHKTNCVGECPVRGLSLVGQHELWFVSSRTTPEDHTRDDGRDWTK